LADFGAVGAEAMYNTFNMGLGFVLILPPTQAQQAITHFQSQHIPAFTIGEVVEGSGELIALFDS
jgi:phosphoribosylformylglycinamidine cyclo-ligase